MVACLAGAKGPYTRTKDGTEITEATLDDFAHTWRNSPHGLEYTWSHEVDEKGNAFGFMDMLGNVAEWVADATNDRRIAKGGSCLGTNDDYRASARLIVPDSKTRHPGVGFRICAPMPDWDKAGRDAIGRLASEMMEVPGLECLVSKYEATQALWYGVMGKRPSSLKGMRRPVTGVSWEKCQKFLDKLNALEAVAHSGLRYRLPTRDEWRHAALGGGTNELGRHADGADVTLETLDRIEWYKANSSNLTHAVGLKEPNAFGLYDMVGNVAEMTSHHYNDAAIAFARGCDYAGFPPKNHVTKSDSLILLSARGRFGFRLVADRVPAKSEDEPQK